MLQPLTRALALAAMLAATPAMAGLRLNPPAKKTAFDHQLTWNCPDKKTDYPDGKERYNQRDLALNTVHAKYDAKELLTFKEIEAGKKPPVVTQAMLDARVAKASDEFAKVLAECQTENGWTDDERDMIREYTIAWAGLSRSTYALFSPDDDVLFRQLAQMNQTEMQDVADGKFPGSARHKAAIADLKASDWYKRTRKYFSLDDPYYQSLVADAYYTKLVSEVMHGRFDESAEKRFPK